MFNSQRKKYFQCIAPNEKTGADLSAAAAAAAAVLTTSIQYFKINSQKLELQLML